ncbi:hypothetical protein [Rhodococcus sp. IEGM 1379]|uniref:hypothetical protein n=1 Tax=Rhodococcus sp. IEGM 1379 TaxID=3047086 RepID=UPI0024B7E609|nr:hypothetical protein [Rhodococcus sp. IEGM 1379]MDI9914214.1 hypothetical protein [Rhodococcus sp. IEGM 1379]
MKSPPGSGVSRKTRTAMGLGLFGPFIRVIAGLEDEPESELTARIYSYVRNNVLGQQHTDKWPVMPCAFRS